MLKFNLDKMKNEEQSLVKTNSLYGRREIAYANFSSPLRNKVAQEMRRNMKLEEMRVIILRKGYIKAK